MRSLTLLFALLISGLSLSAHALPGAELHSVQMPAWVERAGQRAPARAGMVLEPADVLETGALGRLQINLAEGSLVRVGEQARLHLAQLKAPDPAAGALKVLLQLTQGAMRFTSPASVRSGERDIALHLGSLKVDVFGGDVWGRAGKTGDTVCLVEGRLRVRQDTSPDSELVMEQALQYVTAPRDAAPPPLAWIDIDKFRQWAAATDMQSGSGVATATGAWVVQLSSHVALESAAVAQEQMRAAGYAAEVTQVKVRGKTYHRLRVAGFDTQVDAKSFAKRMRGKFSARRPWVALEKASGVAP